MIKNGIKNYIKNFKYFFTPLGAIALGVVFGLSLGIPIVVDALKSLLDMIVKISENTTIRIQDLIDAIWTKAESLDWEKPITALQTLLDKDWLTQTINGCIDSIAIDITQLEIYIGECVNQISSAFVLFIMFIVFGFIGGYFLTKWLVRREIARRALWKYFLISFIDSLLSATLVAGCLWLLTLWKASIFISTLVSLIMFGFIELFEAYIAHAWKKVSIKKIINFKNISGLFCSNLLIFIIAAVMLSIVIAITNVLVGIFVGIALMEIAFIVIGLNAESYVKSVATSEIKDIAVEKLND